MKLQIFFPSVHERFLSEVSFSQRRERDVPLISMASWIEVIKVSSSASLEAARITCPMRSVPFLTFSTESPTP